MEQIRKKTLLIYGANGWIGEQFCDYLTSKNISYYRGKARIENNDELENEILDIQPNNIIGFTGRTHGKIGDKIFSTIDYLEQDGKLYDNIRDNLYKNSEK